MADSVPLSALPSTTSGPPEPSLADAVAGLAGPAKTVNVQISFAVIRLLSEQLYASPVKAIEELVVNSWDAGADNCSVLIKGTTERRNLLAVFDDGAGMTLDQLSELWHVGVSHKVPLTRQRKQIGKFGIGKLASYAVASRVTYITKSDDGILAVTVNFDDLAARTDEATGISEPLTLAIHKLTIDQLRALPPFDRASDVLAVTDKDVKPLEFDLSGASWTMVVLENLRDRAGALHTNRLSWVLETAMPYASDFSLYLDGSLVESNKRAADPLVEFDVGDLDPTRIESLNNAGEDWKAQNGVLVSTKFPSGVGGRIVVTRKSLYQAGGKSEDLGRSHGFFVRVQNRLINETDPLFGARPLSFTTWYHFAAEIHADDLNPYVTASRDDLEQSALKPVLRELLISLFNQARERKETLDKKRADKEKEKLEEDREYVSRTIVEQPLADALSATSGARPDDQLEDWTLVTRIEDESDLAALVSSLYEEEHPRRAYAYQYIDLGSNQPFVRLDAAKSAVTINEGHGLVQEFGEVPESRRLLELFGTAEAMLEAYLHESRVPFEIVREILARRDLLLRSLAKDETQSLVSLAGTLRAAATLSDDSKGFEIAVVGALRSLGFATQHISGSGTPDGTAAYQVYGTEGRKLTLETKASEGTPSLNAIDVAGLVSHARARDVHAHGVMLVAPKYPGEDDAESEINQRAIQQKVSCWTAEQLARVVENAERRHVTAHKVQDIVLTQFTTLDVAAAIEELIGEPSYSRSEIYVGLLEVLEQLKERLADSPRTADMVAGVLGLRPELKGVAMSEIHEALEDLARHSKGLLHFTEKQEIVLFGDLDEVRRRTSALTGSEGAPRRRGTFRSRPN